MFKKLQTGEKIHDAPRQPRTCSHPIYAEYSKTLKHNVRRKAFTIAYFELHSCVSWVSNFQLQRNIVMGMGKRTLGMGHQLLANNQPATSKPA